MMQQMSRPANRVAWSGSVRSPNGTPVVGRIQMIQQPDDVENHANHTEMKKNRSLRLVVALEFGGAVQ